MSFLREGFKVSETGGGYMKFAQGENKIRILTEAIDGFVYWLDGNGQLVPRGEMGGEGSKPVRVRTIKEAMQKTPGAQYDSKQFIAFVVWNYAENAMQILEVTQKGIMKFLEGLTKSEDWGDPTQYDIAVVKTGERLETEYTVRPAPPKPFTEDVAGLSKIDLEALFVGGDPFAEKLDENVTPEEIESFDEKAIDKLGKQIKGEEVKA